MECLYVRGTQSVLVTFMLDCRVELVDYKSQKGRQSLITVQSTVNSLIVSFVCTLESGLLIDQLFNSVLN